LPVDFDTYDAGFFYLSKNYILLKGEKIIMHGVALKSSGKDLLSKSLIKEMAYAKLHEKLTDDIIRKYMKLDFPLEYFAMNTKLGMRPNEYKNKNTLVLRLAMDAKERFGIPITVGQQYYYIKTPSDYMLYDLAKLSDIDKQYYLDEVNDIVDMFQEKHIATSVDKWLK
jgi:DNA polymerase elongation subunit (family B)